MVPGILELEANNTLMVNKAAWATLPPHYQIILKAACWQALVEQMATYDAKNAAALKRLLGAGTQLVSLPPDVVKGLRKALEEVLDEEGAKSDSFKKILANWREFRAEQHQWFGIADTRAELAVYSQSI
jgi:TRAP-type mannitol/chloroaromatic compound transport system substrate-binding protein